MWPTRPIRRSSGIPVPRSVTSGITGWVDLFLTGRDSRYRSMPFRMEHRRPASMESMSLTQQEISDMSLLTRDEAQTLLKKVLSYSKADECEVKISGSEGGNIRYARNSVSTSGALSQTNLQISSVFGKKQGIATINEYDDDSLQKAVARSEELARLAPENPEYLPFLNAQIYAPPANTFIPATAAIRGPQRADMVAQSLQVAKDAGVIAAGFLQNTARV